ncbi:hypothetical protein, partial [Thermogemmatispora sp.]|uniref:hypothetical protein n=1 Tax=Thermogemmatispora sp. TaxID=1968838 RepID=UPI002ACC1512
SSLSDGTPLPCPAEATATFTDFFPLVFSLHFLICQLGLIAFSPPRVPPAPTFSLLPLPPGCCAALSPSAASFAL